jgi:hypothetical protein
VSNFSLVGGPALTQPISSCSLPAAGPVVGETLPLIWPDARSTELISITSALLRTLKRMRKL